MRKAMSLLIVITMTFLVSCTSGIFKNSETSKAEEIVREELDKWFLARSKMFEVISVGSVDFQQKSIWGDRNKEYKKSIESTEIVSPGCMRVRVKFKQNMRIRDNSYNPGDIEDIYAHFVIYMVEKQGKYQKRDFVVEIVDNV